MKADLRDLFFVAAKEVEVEDGKKAIIVFVPFIKHLKFKKIQPRLVRELEKKVNLNQYVHMRASFRITCPMFQSVEMINFIVSYDDFDLQCPLHFSIISTM